MSHLIRIYTVCHSVFDFRLKPLFASVDMAKFRDGRVHLKNSGMKGLNNVERDAVVRGSLWSCWKAKFCLRMIRWFFPGFSRFRPPLMNDLLNISEILLERAVKLK